MSETKKCTRCDRDRELSEFKKRTDGNLHSWCIYCKRKYDREKNRQRRAK